MLVSRNTFFVISLIMLGLTVAGTVMQLMGLTFQRSFLNITTALAFIMPVHYLLHYGYMITTRWKTGFYLLFSLFIIGILAEVQYWDSWPLLLTISILAVPVLYLIYFFFKPFKAFNDILKLVGVLIYFPYLWLVLVLHIHNQYAAIFIFALLYYTYIDFRKIQREREQIMEGDEEEWDFERMESGNPGSGEMPD